MAGGLSGERGTAARVRRFASLIRRTDTRNAVDVAARCARYIGEVVTGKVICIADDSRTPIARSFNTRGRANRIARSGRARESCSERIALFLFFLRCRARSLLRSVDRQEYL